MNDRIKKFPFQVRKWRRYHERRSGFYTTCNFWMKLGIIAFATAPLYGQDVPDWVPFLPVVAGLIAVLDIVWSPANLARDHHDMYEGFTKLETSIETSDSNEDKYADWIRTRKSIEMGAKKRYRALEVYCHNEVARVTPYDDFRRITFWQRLTMNVRPHPHGKFSPSA